MRTFLTIVLAGFASMAFALALMPIMSFEAMARTASPPGFQTPLMGDFAVFTPSSDMLMAEQPPIIDSMNDLNFDIGANSANDPVNQIGLSATQSVLGGTVASACTRPAT